MKSIVIAWAGLLILAPACWAQQAPSPLENYRKLKFPAQDGDASCPNHADLMVR